MCPQYTPPPPLPPRRDTLRCEYIRYVLRWCEGVWLCLGPIAYTQDTSSMSIHISYLNPLTAGVAYIQFLLAHYVPPFKHVKDKM